MGSSSVANGIGSLCFFRLATYPEMASLMLAIASSLVFPWDTHPGNSGTSGHKDAVLILRYKYSQLHTFYHVCIAHKSIHSRAASFIIRWPPLWTHCLRPGRPSPHRQAMRWFVRVPSPKRVSGASVRVIGWHNPSLWCGACSAARRGRAVQRHARRAVPLRLPGRPCLRHPKCGCRGTFHLGVVLNMGGVRQESVPTDSPKARLNADITISASHRSPNLILLLLHSFCLA